ncbi:hypothetical protein RRG08_023797 [Elysia crispata]|uniref:Uncharacterized protein n=1 Tax=Elysia crispata TaxID=231223 RepID=A0AAE1DNK5_9GAST|nr:hypothetical protein RRG08_023797 [Elysia crispata]
METPGLSLVIMRLPKNLKWRVGSYFALFEQAPPLTVAWKNGHRTGTIFKSTKTENDTEKYEENREGENEPVSSEAWVSIEPKPAPHYRPFDVRGIR